MKSDRIIAVIQIIAIVIGSFVFFNWVKGDDRAPIEADVIVAFGDSLTQGYGSTEGNDYVSKLEKLLNKDIINMGVGGETTADALKRIEDVIEVKPDLVIVFFGGNDILRKVDHSVMFGNLQKIIITLQSHGIEVALVGVPGGLITDPLDTQFEALARTYDVIYIPEFMGSLIRTHEYMFDSVHPNDAGYTIVADKIYEGIKEYIK